MPSDIGWTGEFLVETGTTRRLGQLLRKDHVVRADRVRDLFNDTSVQLRVQTETSPGELGSRND